MLYKVRIRWIAEAEVEYEASSADQAEEMAQKDGLPWDVAVEGDDGGSTIWSAEPA